MATSSSGSGGGQHPGGRPLKKSGGPKSHGFSTRAARRSGQERLGRSRGKLI